ncbi:biotin-independent malonate decarboxylase subunit beta [Paenibacillus hexagrammi]|uniref:Biotin-independent malonate decarboxylase subunit beta n=1 Tax=Paenibacillus hexagrammi TaxID=2908839 RepID=A0ABY3SEB8_9BACL|nr:biotin-independent malonate decarboxylase subunit beta [Paenibacillus sp. YPD9-1]UJF31775.1 biotin-independent malonate decarboxylase subunit beta [Paenibacillus sp. YPD9-1]
MTIPIRERSSFIELSARERAQSVMDHGTFRELLGPFEKMESPHLEAQGIVPQSDDGVVIGRGTIDGHSAVVISIESAFLGGGIGEVSGAKIAGALELAIQDNRKGIPTRAVLLLETGGVRLQEGSYGLLAIAEMHAAIVALRRYQPVVCVIAGMIGCYGGMSITAGLCSTVIMTQQGRLQLNGPEVIEQEAGMEEWDSRDRALIWQTVGGVQRYETGMVDILVDDDIADIQRSIRSVYRSSIQDKLRSEQVGPFLARLALIDTEQTIHPEMLRSLWGKSLPPAIDHDIQHLKSIWQQTHSEDSVSRGRTWFQALTGKQESLQEGSPSVLCADSIIGEERIRYIAVVPNRNNRFYRARCGEVGLDEGWTIAHYVRQAMQEDEDEQRRTIVAIVDVPSQAYGYREEMLGIYLACAAAADAYASARLAGHVVIAFMVGNAISGAFLAHGLQANRLVALNDPGVSVQVMSKTSAARVTRRSVEELDETAKKIPATAYDIESFASLGALHSLTSGLHADRPTSQDIEKVKQNLLMDAISASRQASPDLSSRLLSEEAKINRAASIAVRHKLEEQWK